MVKYARDPVNGAKAAKVGSYSYPFVCWQKRSDISGNKAVMMIG